MSEPNEEASTDLTLRLIRRLRTHIDAEAERVRRWTDQEPVVVLIDMRHDWPQAVAETVAAYLDSADCFAGLHAVLVTLRDNRAPMVAVVLDSEDCLAGLEAEGGVERDPHVWLTGLPRSVVAQILGAQEQWEAAKRLTQPALPGHFGVMMVSAAGVEYTEVSCGVGAEDDLEESHPQPPH